MSGPIFSTNSGIFYFEEGILVVEMNEPEHTLEHARDNLRREVEVLGGRRVPLLVDMTRVSSVSREARQFYASPGAVAPFLAFGLLIGSPVSRVIGNFFLGLNRLPRPARLFTSRGDGLRWLQGFCR